MKPRINIAGAPAAIIALEMRCKDFGLVLNKTGPDKAYLTSLKSGQESAFRSAIKGLEISLDWTQWNPSWTGPKLAI